MPSIISGYDEPEPDVTVRRGELRDYDRRKATAEDIALLVEVAVSSLDTDRGEKLRAYAAAGIPTYWIINLNTRRVEVYTAPRGADGVGYAQREERTEADQLDVVIDGQAVGQIAVAAILPAPPVRERVIHRRHRPHFSSTTRSIAAKCSWSLWVLPLSTRMR